MRFEIFILLYFRFILLILFIFCFNVINFIILFNCVFIVFIIIFINIFLKVFEYVMIVILKFLFCVMDKLFFSGFNIIGILEEVVYFGCIILCFCIGI